MKHLTLVEGLPRESIEEKLKEAGINYSVFDNKGAPYFRKCSIHINHPWNRDEMRSDRVEGSRLIELLGYPDHLRGNDYHYYAKYRMEEGFDISNLDGKVTFHNGLLVETTQISL